MPTLDTAHPLEPARRRGLALVGVMFSLSAVAACSGPPVNLRAVWMDKDGAQIHVYDSGVFRAIAASPRPFAGEEHPRVHLGPGGRFMLVREGPEAPRQGRVYDLETRRNFGVSLLEMLPGGQERVVFGARGDVLAWAERVCIDDECSPTTLWVAPLGAGLATAEGGDVLPLLGAGPIDSGTKVFGAANAPVLFSVGVAELGAFRYPGSPADPYELDTLGLAPVLDLPDPATIDACPFPDWCGTRTAVEPQGGGLMYKSTGDACGSGYQRWAPGADPRCLRLPDKVVGARLLAAVGEHQAVFVDEDRLHLVDTASGSSESLPILGVGDYFFEVVDRGRVVVFGSYDGPVLRARADGLTLVSNGTTQCQDPASAVVSSDGSWVAWRCGRAPDVQLGEDFASAIVRVTDSELSRFPGVAAWPIAIDNDGDLLFMTTAGAGEDIPDNDPVAEGGFDTAFSSTSQGAEDESGGFDWGDDEWGEEGVVPGDLFDPFAGGSIVRLTPSPLTLFNLSAEGLIRRISNLEPTPVPVKLMDTGVSRYLQAN